MCHNVNYDKSRLLNILCCYRDMRLSVNCVMAQSFVMVPFLSSAFAFPVVCVVSLSEHSPMQNDSCGVVMFTSDEYEVVFFCFCVWIGLHVSSQTHAVRLHVCMGAISWHFVNVLWVVAMAASTYRLVRVTDKYMLAVNDSWNRYWILRPSASPCPPLRDWTDAIWVGYLCAMGECC